MMIQAPAVSPDQSPEAVAKQVSVLAQLLFGSPVGSADPSPGILMGMAAGGARRRMDPRESVLRGFQNMMGKMTARNAEMRSQIPMLQQRLGFMNRMHNNVPNQQEVSVQQAIRGAIEAQGAKSYDRFASGRSIQDVVADIVARRGAASGVGGMQDVPQQAATVLPQSMPMQAPQGDRLGEYVAMLKAMFPRLAEFPTSEVNRQGYRPNRGPQRSK